MNKNKIALLIVFCLTLSVLTGCKKDTDNDENPTCTDGLQNGTETGVDCGGSCSACVSCSDGIQNGTETDIDCGGSCTPCAAPSFTATVSTLGSFVADTSSSLTYVDSSNASGFTSHRVIARNSPSSTLRFDLNVSINNSIDTIELNKEYNLGNSGGIITTMIFYQTSVTPATFGGNSGKIKFTKINYAARKVSGTFNFEASNGTATRSITDGTFTNLPLQ